MMLYRPHRGSLEDSMNEAIEFDGLDQLVDIIKSQLAGFEVADQVCKEVLMIKPYAYDERIGWDTYRVSLAGYGVMGFTNGYPKQ